MATSIKSQNTKSARVPTLKQVQEFFYRRGISALETWQFYNYYELRKWYGSHKKPLVRWEIAAARWIEMLKSRYPNLVKPVERAGIETPPFEVTEKEQPPIVICIVPAHMAAAFVQSLR